MGCDGFVAEDVVLSQGSLLDLQDLVPLSWQREGAAGAAASWLVDLYTISYLLGMFQDILAASGNSSHDRDGKGSHWWGRHTLPDFW